jgi:hypothetical protein
MPRPGFASARYTAAKFAASARQGDFSPEEQCFQALSKLTCYDPGYDAGYTRIAILLTAGAVHYNLGSGGNHEDRSHDRTFDSPRR